MNYKRYKFVDSNGNQRGIENVNSLEDAIKIAMNYQCEVIDTQIPEGNQIVFSVWNGWNYDYVFYNQKAMEKIMTEIRRTLV